MQPALQQRSSVATHPLQRPEQARMACNTTHGSGVFVVDFAAQETHPPGALLGWRDRRIFRRCEPEPAVNTEAQEEFLGLDREWFWEHALEEIPQQHEAHVAVLDRSWRLFQPRVKQPGEQSRSVESERIQWLPGW